MDARSLQDDNKNAERAAAEKHRKRAVGRLSETKKRNAEKRDEKAQTAKKERRSASEVVQFLKEKSERESVQRKEDLELRRRELSQKEDMMKNASTTTAAAASAHASVCLQTAKIRTVKHPLFYASKS